MMKQRPESKQQLSTKEQIIKLISNGDDNLSAISKKLNLAPSTVSKHLHDLEDNNIIQQKESHNKKWKYYELNPEINKNRIKQNGVTVTRVLIVSGFLVLAILASVYLITYGKYTSARQSSNVSYVPISITDPPQVPQGTQSLYMNYSSLSVYAGNGNNSKWININSSGRLDLLSLVNNSQVIGLANIMSNSTIYKIKFNITSASITINNVTYGVHVAKKEATVNLGNGRKVNSSSDILIDFAPSVIGITNGNNTTFVMVPSLTASVMPYLGIVNQINSGNKMRISSSGSAIFNGPFMHQKLNLSVVSSSLHFNGNNLSFSTTLQNNDNKTNVTILSILIENESGGVVSSGYGITLPGIPGAINPGGPAIIVNNKNLTNNSQIQHQIRINRSGFYNQTNSSVIINGSYIYRTWSQSNHGAININLPNSVNNIMISNPNSGQGFGKTNYPYVVSMPEGVGFMINGNGTLLLPGPTIPQRLPSQIGYAITPHSTASFSYIGEFNNYSNIFPSNQTTYKLVIFTNEGLLQTNITT